MAGGKGTRLKEMTLNVPKPMLEIGDAPILMHIVGHFVNYGVTDFIIPVGYRAQYIFDWFGDRFIKEYGDGVSFMKYSEVHAPVTYTIVHTGENTKTGGRLLFVRDRLPDRFYYTYGDGISDVDLHSVTSVLDSDLDCTVAMTAIKPRPRFGTITFDGDSKVSDFAEKSSGCESWINGGFMAIEKYGLDGLKVEDSFEADFLPKVAKSGGLFAHKHTGFWHCIDTLKDLERAEEFYLEGWF